MSKNNVQKIKKVILMTMIMFVTISFSLNSVSAQSIQQNKENDDDVKEVLTGEDAAEYIKAVEENKSFKNFTSSGKLVKEGNIKVEEFELESSKDFPNDIVVVQTKIDNKKEHSGILAIVDEETYEVYSFTTIEENKDSDGLLFTEYDGETGQVLLKNNVVDNKVVDVKDNSQIQPAAIEKGSYWWNVICNLATSGSCSLGCLALIAVPGGYPACTLLCSALTGSAACS